jgi:sugar lactone lactonase YvrE
VRRLALAWTFAFACSAPSVEIPEAPDAITTFMGTGAAALSPEGLAPEETALYLPLDLAISDEGEVFVLDWNNHRILATSGDRVRVIAGSGLLGDAKEGPAREVELNHPSNIELDPNAPDRLIVAAWHNSRVLEIDLSRSEVHRLAGTGERKFRGDLGPATVAALDLPSSTAIDRQGRMFVMDQANQRIRMIDQDGTISTIAGPPSDWVPEGCPCTDRWVTAAGYFGDGGPALGAHMFQSFGAAAPPAGKMAIGPDGILYFADTENGLVRAVSIEDREPQIWTVAGTPPEECAPSRERTCGRSDRGALDHPTDLAIASDGTIFIADNRNSCIRRLHVDGTMDTVAGRCGVNGFSGDGGPAIEALLDRPYGIALDRSGRLYIADTHNQRIRVTRPR